MWMFCGAYVDSEFALALREDIFGSNRDCDLSDKQFALMTGVAFSRISEMKKGLDAGPGMLRLSQLPSLWWKAFIARRAKRYCQRVIDDAQIDKLIATLNLYMVQGMERQLRTRRPVKASLPQGAKREKAS